MPRLKESLIADKLSEAFPDKTFEFKFYGLVGFKNHAFGVNEDGLYMLRMSMFRLRPKGSSKIRLADITDISFDRGDIGGMQILIVIKTANLKLAIKSNKVLGYDPTAQAELAYKFIAKKTAKA